MSTVNLAVPVGTSAPFPVGPNMSICAGPAAKGGTVLVELSATQGGPWSAIPVSGVFASPDSTDENVLYSLRFPPGSLKPGFRMDVRAVVSATNNAHTKTVAVEINNPTGPFASSVTTIYSSPDLASNANLRFLATLSGGANGALLRGFGAGDGGGLGLSAVAFSTLVQDFQSQELEIVITGTKDTGADVLQLDAALITVYN
jgi:hypothetical protein